MTKEADDGAKLVYAVMCWARIAPLPGAWADWSDPGNDMAKDMARIIAGQVVSSGGLSQLEQKLAAEQCAREAAECSVNVWKSAFEASEQRVQPISNLMIEQYVAINDAVDRLRAVLDGPMRHGRIPIASVVHSLVRALRRNPALAPKPKVEERV